jgi:diacylglycerol kinase (ATP)
VDIILYNPLSRNGKNKKFIEKIEKKLRKKGQAVVTHSLLEIDDIDTFSATCAKDDRIIIVGGDGTLNRLANRVMNYHFEQKIYLYQAGTGNDFARSLKTKEKMIQINDHIKNLPYILFNDEKKYFLNGAGMGLDGYVGELVNHSRFKKNKINYFRHAIEAFVKFKPFQASITVDNHTYEESKLWLASMMHGAYFGGGMKIAPKANRNEDHLYLVLVKDIPKWLLIIIFPTIYLGWHVIFKKYVKIMKANSIKIKSLEPTYMQIDGETEYPILEVTTKSRRI